MRYRLQKPNYLRRSPTAPRCLVAQLALGVLGFLIAATIIVLAHTASASAAEAHVFSPPPIGSAGSGAAQLHSPSATAVYQASGDFYVIDAGNHRVDKFTGTGVFILSFGKEVDKTTNGDVCTAASGDVCQAGISATTPGAFEEPSYLAVDNSTGPSQGDVYVGDAADNVISKFDSSGELIETWGNGGPLETPDGQLGGIATPPNESLFGVAVGSSGTLYVGINEIANTTNQIYKFRQDGTSEGAPMPIINGIIGAGLSVDAEGDFYVNDGLLTKISPAGQAISSVGSGGIASFALDPSNGDIYIASRTSVARYTSAGLVQELGFGSGHITSASGLAIAHNHRAYVVDSGASDVEAFDSVIEPTTDAGKATEIGHATAVLNGTVNPEEITVEECVFEYVTESAFNATGFADLSSGGTAACEHPDAAELGSGNEAREVHARIAGLTPVTAYRFRLSAKNENGTQPSTEHLSEGTLETPPAVTELKTGEASDITNESATLHGSFTAEEGLTTHYYFEYGNSPDFGRYAPLPPPGAEVPGPALNAGSQIASQSSPIAQLTPGTTYHFRIVAENKYGVTEGAEGTFTTAQPPSIAGLSSSAITATSAVLHARIEPHGFATTCRFEYGTTTAYGQSIPCPLEITEHLSEGHSVEVPIVGLQPGVSYHFRLLAENKWDQGHPVTSEDQSFEFFPSSCPNSAVRQQTGSAYLPDCRAYELVSPPNANATLLYPGGPETGQATSPSRFTFTGAWSALPGTDTIETVGDLYVATRTDTGWVSKYVGLPGNQAGCMGGPPTLGTSTEVGHSPSFLTDTVLTDPAMSHFLSFLDGGPAECAILAPVEESSAPLVQPSAAPYLFSSEGVNEGRLPTVAASPASLAAFQCPDQGLFQGLCNGETTASPDLTQLLFSSNQLDFASGEESGQGLTKAPGSAYEEDLATGKLTLISKLPDGEPIPQDPAFATVPPAHESEGRNETPVTAPGGAEEFLRFPAVSTDGSHVLISTATARTRLCGAPGGSGPQGAACPRFTDTPVHLYMRVDDAVTYEIAESQTTGQPAAVTYVGMTPDGSKVYFTSEEHLNGENPEHAGASLYMWSENGGHPTLTLISKAAPGSPPAAGDTAACHPALVQDWIQKGGGYENGGQVPWTAGCGVLPVSTYSWSFQRGARGGNGITDSALASQSGDIYFYSPEQLDGDHGIPGQQNLYLYRGGGVHYVTTFSPEHRCTELGTGSSRGSCRGAVSEGPILRIDVSPDGSHMAFLSASRLTAYDNAGHPELYSYSPATGAVNCDSCNPDGRPATADVEASQDGLFMTDDGRTFFSTTESLLPSDTNGGYDVYEYVDGRPQLITPGTGTATSNPRAAQPPGLAGVSANGTDVYFSTYDTLVSEDHNGNFLKFYDARTDGGFAQPSPAQPCVAAEECHGPGTEPPTLPTQGTAATLTGGNAKPESHAKHHKKKSKRTRKKATAVRHHKHGGKK